MEALGVAASIIAVVQLTTACLKLGNKYLGPSIHDSTSLKALLSTLYNFNGTVKNLQTHLEINEEDHARLETLRHLGLPLQRCEEALNMIQDRLKAAGVFGQYVIGSRFDSKLQKALKGIEDSRVLFELALKADQQ